MSDCLKNLPWIEQFMTRFIIIIAIAIIVIAIIVITIVSYMSTRFAALPQVAAYLTRPTYRSFSFSHSFPFSLLPFSHSSSVILVFILIVISVSGQPRCLPHLHLLCPKNYNSNFIETFRPFPIWSMRAKYGYRPTSS